MSESSVINELKNLRASIEDIFQLCPFDQASVVGKKLTLDYFYKHLFIQPEKVDSFIKILISKIKNKTFHNQFINIYGYPGTGKTTFINRFQYKTKNQYDHHYLDFGATTTHETHETHERPKIIAELKKINLSQQDFSTYIEIMTRIQPPQNGLQATIKNHLLTYKWNVLSDIFEFFTTNLIIYQGHLSSDFLEILQKRPAKQEMQLYSSKILQVCSFIDLMHILVLTLHKTTSDLIKVIVFDNLDHAKTEHIADVIGHQLYDFHNSATTIYNGTAILGKPLYLGRDYRFILCLRKANHEVAKSHLLDRHQGKYAEIFYEIDSSYELLSTRIKLAEQIFPEDSDEMRTLKRLSVLQNFFLPHAYENLHDNEEPQNLAIHGMYFKHVISPLFNFDNRKLNLILIRAANANIDIEPKLEPEREPETPLKPEKNHKKIKRISNLKWKRRYSYGVGGSLIYCITKSLQKNDFASSIFNDSEDDFGSGKEGNCLLLRMILTVTLNHSSFRHTKLRTAVNERCNISRVINSLSPMYDTEKILRKIAECFLFHENNWVNLISIREKTIFSLDSFDDECEYYSQKSHNPLAKKPHSLKVGKIGITTAGYVFLKHILPHFEFYSSLVNNQLPLFSCGFKRKNKFEFLFDSVIQRVYRLIEYHTRLMDLFFRNKVNMTPSEFKSSALCFKHLGSFNEPKAEFGRFHGCRLVNSMVNYIDCFRLLLNISKASQNTHIYANRALVEWIDKFSQLHNRCADPDSTYSRERHVSRIRSIRKTGYRDLTSVIVDQTKV